MFGWKGLIIGAVLVGGLKVADTYHRVTVENNREQRTAIINQTAIEMEKRAQQLVDGDLITRATVQPLPLSNLLRVTLSAAANLNDLKKFGVGFEKDVSEILCTQHLNLIKRSDVSIQLKVQTLQQETGIDFLISKSACLANGYS